MSDLFIENGNGNGHDKNYDPVVDTYTYHDENGNPLFRVCRTALKDFKAQRYESGAFIWGVKGVRRVPYKLPAVIKSKTVIIVEGEKDVETLRKLGLVATTNPFGAGKWDDSYNQFFKDKHVAVIGDNDEAGRLHALKIATSLLSVEEQVRLVKLPDVPEQGDVTDYVAKHANRAKEELIALIKATKLFTAEDVAGEQITDNSSQQNDLGVNCYPADEENEPVKDAPVCFPEKDAWQGAFSIWRDIVCPATESPEEYLWLSCLETIGLALGRSVVIRNPRSLYPNFYGLMAGQTGDDRKSTALDFSQEALFHLGLTDSVHVLHGIQSSEAIFDSLGRCEGAKTLAHLDELRSLLGVTRRTGAGDIIPRLGSLYYCPAHESLDRHGEESTIITKPFLSLITATPLEYVQDLLGEREINGGFLNRFLTITGKPRSWKAIACPPEAHQWEPFTTAVKDIASHYNDHRFTWTDESKALWGEFYVGWKTARQDWSAREQQLTARIDEHILKIALVYSAIKKESELTCGSLVTAISIGKWLQSVALDAFSEVGHTAFSKAENVVLRIVRKHKRIYRRYLQQRVYKFGIDGDVLNRVIQSLVKNGQLIEGKETMGSGHQRPWVEYVLPGDNR